MSFIKFEKKCNQILIDSGVDPKKLELLRELHDIKKCADIHEETSLNRTGDLSLTAQILSSFVSCQAYRLAEWQEDDVFKAAFYYISQDLDCRPLLQIMRGKPKEEAKTEVEVPN